MTSSIRHLAFATALMLGSCASTSPPANFYTLSVPAQPGASPARASAPLFIELMPVRVPERLARPQIVVRSAGASKAQVRILEQERWSSPFNDELHDAFASAITDRLGAIDVSHSGQTGARSYRVAIELVQFDAVPDDEMQARFSWSIKRSDDGKGTVCETAVDQPVSGGVSGVVLGMQQAVASVAQQISASIGALEASDAAACDGVPH